MPPNLYIINPKIMQLADWANISFSELTNIANKCYISDSDWNNSQYSGLQLKRKDKQLKK